jgi:hypothetical protein
MYPSKLFLLLECIPKIKKSKQACHFFESLFYVSRITGHPEPTKVPLGDKK